MRNLLASEIPPMRANGNRLQTLLPLAGAIILSGAVLGAEMSATDIIKKSEAAYAAVKTYVGTTTVRTKAEIGETKLDQVSLAKVTFARPGKVRIEGKTASGGVLGQGGHPFAIISDGTKTWKSWAIQNNGAFAEVRNVAGAGMGGVAQGAAEAMAAALMKSDGAWTGGSDPFIAPRLAGARLEGHEKIDGADCYKLASKHAALGDVTMWIDSKTFLLVQMMRELNEEQLAKQAKVAEAARKSRGKELPANRPATKSMVSVFSFKNDKVDGPVDETLFADPTKK